MLDTGRNIDDITRHEHSRLFAVFLIPARAVGTKKNLTASAFSVVNMPIVAAARLKGDVCNGYLLGRKHLQIAVADEILFKSRVRLSFRKNTA